MGGGCGREGRVSHKLSLNKASKLGFGKPTEEEKKTLIYKAASHRPPLIIPPQTTPFILQPSRRLWRISPGKESKKQTQESKMCMCVLMRRPVLLFVPARSPLCALIMGKRIRLFARIAPSLSRSEQKVARSELTVQRHAARSWDRSCLPEVFYRVNAVTQ